MRLKTVPQAKPVKSNSKFILLSAIWGAIAGLVMLSLFVSPVINLKYVFRYLYSCIFASMALGSVLSIGLSLIQIKLLKSGKL